ncbi:25747_t:CDS:2, partial [Racocetra persica]
VPDFGGDTRHKRDVSFNDIKRVAGFMSSYHPDDIEVERKRKKIAENNDEPKEIHVEVEVEVEND